MSKQQKVRKFTEHYGKPNEHLDQETWVTWLGVYLAGWSDAEEQECSLCGDQVNSAPDLCWSCYHLETESDAE